MPVAKKSNSAVPEKCLELEQGTAYRFSVLEAMGTRFLSDMYSSRFRLTVAGWRTLSLIGKFAPIYPSEVAYHSSLEADKVTRAVNKLVAKGFVVRKGDRKDRRRVVLMLTPKGRRVYKEIDDIRKAIERRFLSVLSAKEMKAFFAAMDKLEANARLIFKDRGAWKAIVADEVVGRKRV